MSAVTDRLQQYNGDPYKAATNPYGLDGADNGVSGFEKNLPQALNDVGAAAAALGVWVAAQSTVTFAWDAATTVADPGAGKVRATTATPSAGVYSLIVSTTDAAGGDVSAVLSDLGASTSAVKARARLVAVGTPSAYVDLLVSAIAGAGAYRTVTVTAIGGPAGFVAGAQVALGWVRVGDKGDQGGATLPPGSAAAPGLAVTGDSNTGLAQVGGADTLSVVAGGTEVLRTVGTVGAVNNIVIGNTATGVRAAIQGRGGDANVGISLDTKGAGDVFFTSQQYGSINFQIGGGYINAVNYFSTVGSVTGNAVLLSALGADADISAAYATKGAGSHLWRTGGTFVQAAVLHTAGATRYLTLTGSASGAPTISTSAGALNLTSATGQVLINGAAIGTGGYPTISKTSAYTVTLADAGKMIEASGVFPIGLLGAAAAGNGFVVGIAASTSSTITVVPAGSDTINGAGWIRVPAGVAYLLISNGSSNWITVGGSALAATLFSNTNKSSFVAVSNNGTTATAAAGIGAENGWITTNAGYANTRFYCEVALEVLTTEVFIGIARDTWAGGWVGNDANSWGYASGLKHHNGSNSAYGTAATAGSRVGIAVDGPAGKGWWRLNGVWQGGGDPVTGANAAFTDLSGTILLAMCLRGAGSKVTLCIPQASWLSAGPTGFPALA